MEYIREPIGDRGALCNARHVIDQVLGLCGFEGAGVEVVRFVAPVLDELVAFDAVVHLQERDLGGIDEWCATVRMREVLRVEGSTGELVRDFVVVQEDGFVQAIAHRVLWNPFEICARR